MLRHSDKLIHIFDVRVKLHLDAVVLFPSVLKSLLVVFRAERNVPFRVSLNRRPVIALSL